MKSVYLAALLSVAGEAVAQRVPPIAVGPELKEDAPSLAAPIETVTVFSDRARVVRRVRADAKAGINAFRLPDLPGGVLLDTVRVSANGARVIRAEASPVEREVVSIEQVKGLVDELEKITDRIAELESTLAIERRELERIHGVHPAPPVDEKDRDGRKPLAVATDAWFKSIDFLGDRDVAARARIQKAELEVGKLAVRRDEIAGEIESKNLGAFTDVRVEVFVAIDSPAAKKVDLALEYFMTGARWKPTYDLRYEPDGRLTVETAALVQQATGEDWPDVALLLSTAIPGQGIDLPELLTWTLSESREFLPQSRAARGPPPLARFAPPVPKPTRAEERRRIEIELLRMRYAQAIGRPPADAPPRAEPVRTRAPASGGLAAGEYAKDDDDGRSYKKAEESAPRAPAPVAAPTADVEFESLSLEGSVTTVSGSADYRSAPSFVTKPLALFETQRAPITFADPYLPAVSAGGLDYVYEAPTRATIPSLAEDRRVPLAAQSFQADAVYEATPALDATAYVKAKVKNGSDRPLLAGQTNIFVGGEFVGQGELRTTGPGGEIGFPLGADENVRLVRTVVPTTKRVGVFSKDDVTTYAVELQIGNYKKRPITIEVIDQIPKTNHEDVEVKFLSAVPAALKEIDADGVLRWRISVPPNQTKKIQFSYTIGRPADWQLQQQ